MYRSLIILAFLLSSFSGDHALYVSVIELEHENKATKYSFSIKVFKDDLANALRNFESSADVRDLSQLVDRNKRIINDYFGKQLKIKVGKTEVSFLLKDSQDENDAVFLNFEGLCPAKWNSISIKAPYFTEVYPDQSNIVQLEDSGRKFYGRITITSTEFIADLSD